MWGPRPFPAISLARFPMACAKEAGVEAGQVAREELLVHVKSSGMGKEKRKFSYSFSDQYSSQLDTNLDIKHYS